MSTKFSAWIKQPSTIQGIGALIGVAAGSAASVITKQHTIGFAAGAVVYGAVNALLPDNTAEAKPLQKLVSDAVNAAASHAVSQRLPQLIADIQGVLSPVLAQAAVQTAAAAPAAAAPAVPVALAAPS